jgi:hypothetical protein
VRGRSARLASGQGLGACRLGRVRRIGLPAAHRLHQRVAAVAALASLTLELVGGFRLAAARAGLDGAVRCGAGTALGLDRTCPVRRQPGHFLTGEVEHELANDGGDGGAQFCSYEFIERGWAGHRPERTSLVTRAGGIADEAAWGAADRGRGCWVEAGGSRAAPPPPSAAPGRGGSAEMRATLAVV